MTHHLMSTARGGLAMKPVPRCWKIKAFFCNLTGRTSELELVSLLRYPVSDNFFLCFVQFSLWFHSHLFPFVTVDRQ